MSAQAVSTQGQLGSSSISEVVLSQQGIVSRRYISMTSVKQYPWTWYGSDGTRVWAEVRARGDSERALEAVRQ